MIKKYTKKDGSVAYMFQVYLGINPSTGKAIKKTRRGFNSYSEAKIEISRLKTQYAHGVLETNKRITFRTIYDQWLLQYEKTVKVNTFEIQKQVNEKKILPFLENKYLDKITVKHWQDLVNTWYASYTKAANLVSIVRRVFKFAMAHNYITHNPMDLIVVPKNTHKKEYDAPFYDKEELKLFLSKLDRQSQEYITCHLLAFTGLRKAELLGLQWQDLQGSKLSVERVIVRSKKTEYTYQSPKTKSSRRLIQLDTNTIQLLHDHKVKQQKKMLSLGFNTNNPAQPIFVTNRNTPVPPERLNRILNKIIQEHQNPTWF